MPDCDRPDDSDPGLSVDEIDLDIPRGHASARGLSLSPATTGLLIVAGVLLAVLRSGCELPPAVVRHLQPLAPESPEWSSPL